MINRQTAYDLVKQHISNPNMIRHSLSVSAVMRGLALRFGEDEELWGLTGLLHDLDTDQTINDYPRHGYLTCELLEGELPDDALHAIRVHPGHIPPQNRFDWSLYCADPVTGLITAAVLVHPSHQLAEIKVSSLRKKFKDKSFAAGANRSAIQGCEQIGLELEQFLELSLTAMQGISQQLEY